MNILIEIDSQHKGLLIAIGKYFINLSYNVNFVARDKMVEKIIKRELETSNYKIFLLPDFEKTPQISDHDQVIKKSKE